MRASAPPSSKPPRRASSTRRAQFSDATLVDLHDPPTRPPVLVKAHQQLDKAIDAACIAAEKAAGHKAPKPGNDAKRVAFRFGRYQALTSVLPAA